MRVYWTGADCRLKKYTLDKADEIEFTRLGVKNLNIRYRLLTYLTESKETVDIQETYDGQSAWSGFRFIIGGEDLSLNGFCFSESRLDEYLKGKVYNPLDR